MGTWFTHRERKIFHRLSLLERFEVLVSKNREKLAPKGISDLFGFLQNIRVGARRTPAVLTGMVGITGDYKSHVTSIFDPYNKERNEWSKKSAQLKKQLTSLDTMPWNSFSPRGQREREAEMVIVSGALTSLDTKLAGIPVLNTFEPEELYRYLSVEELEKKGFVLNTGEVYPRITEVGTRVCMAAEDMFNHVEGKLNNKRMVHDEKFLDDLSKRVWNRMRGVYVQ